MVTKLSDEVYLKYAKEIKDLRENKALFSNTSARILARKVSVKFIEATATFLGQDQSKNLKIGSMLYILTNWVKAKPQREMIQFIHMMIDAAIEDHAQNADGGDYGTISCRKGCAFCCYQQVKIAKPEADLLNDLISENPSLINRDLLKTQKKWKVNQKGSPWHEINLRRCPFLSDDNLCNVYEHRPSACRNHRSIDPVLWCDENTAGVREIRFVNQFEIALLINALVNIYDCEPIAHMIEV